MSDDVDNLNWQPTGTEHELATGVDGWVQDPTVSVPDLIDDVVAQLELPADAARYVGRVAASAERTVVHPARCLAGCVEE